MGSRPRTAELRDRLAHRCLELVRIPSVTGEEAAIADHLEAWAHDHSALRPEAVAREGNALLLGTLDLRPAIALVGHLDTVPPDIEAPEPHWMGDRIVGLGAADMKGSLAVMQLLFETLPLESLPFSMMGIFYDREEGPVAESGLQPLLDRHPELHDLDLAVTMEPTDNTLQLGCLGTLQARVVFVGKSAHSGRPWEGENAIHKAGPFLARLRERPFREVMVDGLAFRDVMSATLADGGRARNVIPGRFELNVNYRFPPAPPLGEAVSRAELEVRALAEDAEVEIIDAAPPGPVPTNNPVLDHFLAHADLEVRPQQGWTDVSRFAAHGVDAINFGPGSGAQAHRTAEWVSVQEMVRCFDLLTQMLTSPLEV